MPERHPSSSSALISVRLKPGLSDAERSRAIALIRDAVRMPQWKLSGGATYVVTGVPVPEPPSKLRSDVPHDTAHPLYAFGFGLSY